MQHVATQQPVLVKTAECQDIVCPSLLIVRYHGKRSAAEAALPFDAGFESVGVVVATGPEVAGTVQPYAVIKQVLKEQELTGTLPPCV